MSSHMPKDRNFPTVVSILQQLGSAHRSRQEWEKADRDLTEALRIVDEHPSLSIDKTNIWIGLADVYRKQRKYNLAAEICQQVLAVGRDILLPQQCAETNNILGIVYAENPQGNIAENLENAIACYEQSLETKRQLGACHGETQTLSNLGIVYYKQGKWDEAIVCYEQALEIFHQLGDRHGIGQTLMNLGLVRYRCNQIERATTFWREALTYIQRSSPEFQAVQQWLETSI
jgi:tetratricopeptide (TPR) repeat protein